MRVAGGLRHSAQTLFGEAEPFLPEIRALGGNGDHASIAGWATSGARSGARYSPLGGFSYSAETGTPGT